MSFLVRKGEGGAGSMGRYKQEGERKQTLKKGKLGQAALNHHGQESDRSRRLLFIIPGSGRGKEEGTGKSRQEKGDAGGG